MAARLPTLLAYHSRMLGDTIRNHALREAITAHVTPDTSFLDVGSGTGVWAILAAVLGARRVVAIEQEEALVPVLYRQARENGVADRVDIVHGNVDDVRLRGRFDVIVCELFGSFALGPKTMQSFASVRDRFLAPGGVLVPQRITMVAAPCRVRGRAAGGQDDVPIKTGYLRWLLSNHAFDLTMGERSALELLAKPQPLVDVDLRTIDTPPSLLDLRAQWFLEDPSQVEGVVVYNRHWFTDLHVIDSLQSPSWGVALHRVEPFAARPGDLEFSVSLGSQPHWGVSSSADPAAGTRNYSPALSVPALRRAQRDAVYRTARRRPSPR